MSLLSGLRQFSVLCLFCLLLAGIVVAAESAGQGEAVSPPSREVMRLVTILREDERGRDLRFPMNVTADSDAKEIYVVNGGQSNIIVYGADFFPYLVLGAGRGVDAPQCVFFDMQEGRVYVGQNKTADKPSRLTILNAAFLPEKEVVFADMPGGEDFTVKNGMVGARGKIYLIGNHSRGVLVLNGQAEFSHWLKPLGKIPSAAIQTTDSSEKRRAYLQGEMLGDGPPEEILGDRPVGLPAGLVPKSSREIPRDSNRDKGLHPVLLDDVTIDSDGRIFLLSEEMSKVYVYGPGENLIFSFGQKGGAPGKMSRPRGLCLDEKKKCLYVVDYMRHTILVFDLAGRFIFEFGGRGEGPMWFNFPTAIDVDFLGRVIVADLFNNRVQVFESDFTMDYPVFGKTKGGPGTMPVSGEEK